MKKKTTLYLIIIFIGLFFFAQLSMSAEIVINVSGGAYLETLKKCYFNPFEEATGHKLLYEPGANFGKLRAMVKSGNVEWDMAEAESQDLIIKGVKENILEPIDYNIIVKDEEELYTVALKPYSVGTSFYSTVMGYNLEKYPEGKGPNSWKDFWDVKKFPGPRSLQNTPYNNLEIALLADGVPPDKLYPLDVDRAFRSLDKIKPHITVWWTAGAQPAQLLTDKEVDMASAWNGRLFTIQKEGAKVKTVWNEAILMFGAWVIPKGAKNAKIAMELINFTHKRKNQACFAESVAYPGLNKHIFSLVDKKFAKSLPTYPENFKAQVPVNFEWWAENRDKVQDMWNAWMLKK
jgi:putative spermidine/putrescine transport system substrate-binding protein